MRAVVVAALAVLATVAPAVAATPEAIDVVNRTPLLAGVVPFQVLTDGTTVLLRGGFYWKTVHGEDVETFVLDVTFIDGDGGVVGRSTLDGAGIQLGRAFEVPIGRWGDALPRERVRAVLLTPRRLTTLLSC